MANDVSIRIALQGIANIQQQLNAIAGSFSGLSDSVSGSATSMRTQLNSTTSSMNALVGAGLAWAATKISGPLKAFGKSAIGMAGQMQQAEMGFTTLFRSAKKAMEFLEELRDFAASTPFEFVGLQNTARRMVALGFETKQVIPVLRVLGDTVGAMGGTQEQLDRIIYNMGQMKMIGKVTGHEMRDLAMAGVKAWDYLASAIGKDVPTAMEQARKGTIDAKTALVAVFMGMQRDFGGGMEKQMGLLTQGFSNMRDEMSFVLAEIGKTLNETFKIQMIVSKVTSVLHELRTNWERIPGPIKSVIAVIGGLLAVLPPLLLLLSGIGLMIPKISAGLAGVGLSLTKVTALFATLSNPVTAAIAAIVALGAAIILLNKHFDSLALTTEVTMMKVKILIFNTIADILEKLPTINDVLKNIFAPWSDIAKDSYETGIKIGEGFRTGILDGLVGIYQLGNKIGKGIEEGKGPVTSAVKSLREAAQEELGKLTVLQEPARIKKEFADMQKNFNALVQMMAKNGANIPKLLNQFKDAGGNLGDLSAMFEYLKQLAGDDFMKLFGQDTKGAGKEAKEVTNILSDLNAKLKENQIMFNISTSAGTQTSRAFEKLKEDIAAHKSALSSLLKEPLAKEGQIAEITYQIKVLGDQLFIDQMHEVGVKVANLQEIMTAAGVPVEELTMLFKEGEDPIKQMEEFLDSLSKKYEEITKPITELEAEFKKNAKAAQQFGGAINLAALNADSTQQAIMKLNPVLKEDAAIIKILVDVWKYYKQEADRVTGSIIDVGAEMLALDKKMKDNVASSKLLGKEFDLNKAQMEATKETMLKFGAALGPDNPLTLWVKQYFELFKEGADSATKQTREYEDVVQRVASSIKSIWSGTRMTLKDVWHKMLDDFVDILAQMVINNAKAAKEMSETTETNTSKEKGAIGGAQAGAQSGGWAGAIIGAMAGFMVGVFAENAATQAEYRKQRKENNKVMNDLPKNLKGVFDEFTINFKNALSSFKERLYPTSAATISTVKDIQVLSEAATRLSMLLPITKFYSKPANLEYRRGLPEESEFSPTQITITKKGESKGSGSGGIEVEKLEFSAFVAELIKIKEVLRGIDIETGVENIQETTMWTKSVPSEVGAGISKAMLSIVKSIADRSVDLTELLITQFEKAKSIAMDVLGLLDSQKSFTKSIDDSIKDVQRSTMGDKELFSAQLADIEAIKNQVKDGGEHGMALLAEIAKIKEDISVAEAAGNTKELENLKYLLNSTQQELSKFELGQVDVAKDLEAAYKTAWSTAQQLFDPTDALAEVERLKQAYEDAGFPEERAAIQAELDVAQEEANKLQAELLMWQADIVEGLEAVKDIGKDAYEQMIDINLEMLNIARDTTVPLETQMKDYLKNIDKMTLDSLQAIKDLGAIMKEPITDKSTEQIMALLETISEAADTLKTIPAYASGGVVSKPTLAMIGEDGPEVVLPLDKPDRMRELMKIVSTDKLKTPFIENSDDVPMSNPSEESQGFDYTVRTLQRLTKMMTGLQTKPIREFKYGGIVNSPTVGLVGEAGPEAIVPLDKYDRLSDKMIENSINFNFSGPVVTDEIMMSKWAKTLLKHIEKEQGRSKSWVRG